MCNRPYKSRGLYVSVLVALSSWRRLPPPSWSCRPSQYLDVFFRRLLGVNKEASFEEIQDARNFLYEVRFT